MFLVERELKFCRFEIRYQDIGVVPILVIDFLVIYEDGCGGVVLIFTMFIEPSLKINQLPKINPICLLLKFRSSKTLSETPPIHLDPHYKVVASAEIYRLRYSKLGGR